MQGQGREENKCLYIAWDSLFVSCSLHYCRSYNYHKLQLILCSPACYTPHDVHAPGIAEAVETQSRDSVSTWPGAPQVPLHSPMRRSGSKVRAIETTASCMTGSQQERNYTIFSPLVYPRTVASAILRLLANAADSAACVPRGPRCPRRWRVCAARLSRSFTRCCRTRALTRASASPRPVLLANATANARAPRLPRFPRTRLCQQARGSVLLCCAQAACSFASSSARSRPHRATGTACRAAV